MDKRILYLALHKIVASRGSMTQKELTKALEINEGQLNMIIALLEQHNLIFSFVLEDESMYMATLSGVQYIKSFAN